MLELQHTVEQLCFPTCTGVYTYTYSACTCLPSYVCIYFIVHSSGVTVRYEEEQYTAAEEAGYVTLVLVLDGDAVIPVTVSVNTLDLVNSSVGDAATGELATH